MICSGCQTVNRDGRKFCSDCGQLLELQCKTCGFSNLSDEKFCGGCGVSLTQEEAKQTSSAAPRPEPNILPRERRQVTIFFADISSFTRMSKELDPEDTYGVLQRFFDTADSIIERFGGTIDKHIGDAVMGLFGAPIAYGDDPVRAVHAAIELHAAVARLNAESQYPFSVHIGIAAGEVVVGGFGGAERKDYTVIGDSVNLAARLEELAQTGETLISSAVYHAVSHLVACEPVENVDHKALGSRVWRVIGLDGGANFSDQSPIVGREAEVRHVEALLDGVHKHGRSQTVLIRGDAGIGKTRLIQEYCTLARQRGFQHFGTQVIDFGAGEGQDAIRILVRNLFGLTPTDPSDACEQKLYEATKKGLVRSDFLPFLFDLMGIVMPAELEKRYQAMDYTAQWEGKNAALADLVQRLSAKAPLLITFEDLHWARSVTLGFLAGLLTKVVAHRVMIVMSTRNEGDPMSTSWSGKLKSVPLVALNLTPLGPDASRQMAKQFFELSSNLVSDCITRADGNPLFLQQLLRNAGDTERVSLPATIQSLVLARMDKLAPKDREALQILSVAGQRVEGALVEHLLGTTSFDFSALISSELLREDNSQIIFSHSLIRDGAYSSMLRSSAREIHRKAAEFYENHDYGLWAEHLDKGKDPRATFAYLKAAEFTQNIRHLVQAQSFVERGLELVSKNGPAFDLHCINGELLEALGNMDDAVLAYEAALKLAEDDEQRCRALIGIVRGKRDAKQADAALALLERAEDMATHLSNPRLLAQIHAQRGNIFFPRGQVDACHREQLKSLEFAQTAGSVELEAEALSGLGDAEYVRGRMKSAAGYFDECVTISRDARLFRIEVPNLALRGLTNFYAGDALRCMEDCQSAISGALDSRQTRAELVARTALAPALIEALMLKEAKQETDLATRAVDTLGAHRFMPECCIFSAKIAYYGKNLDVALTEARRAVDLSLENDAGRSFTGPWALGTLACVAQDPAERTKALAQGAELLTKECVSHNFLWFYRDAIEASLHAKDWKAALNYAEALRDYTAQEPLSWSDTYIKIAHHVARRHGLDASDDGTGDQGDLLRNLKSLQLNAAARLLEQYPATA